MTIEETNLLFKDICGRLRSGLICSIYREDDEGFGWRDTECKGYFQNNDSYEFYFEDVIAIDNIERLKPYLRPMSSMTEEEKIELCIRAYAPDEMKTIDEKLYVIQTNAKNATDFYNEHHLDYRGLIPMGLALEAPEGMYNIKTK